ncbi:hypothetical protein SISNIDRAFT_469448 [Sistotremastrum niveocremeum HHB9708]|uniref:Uncharacterized protein n=1 Tax=Sistotremastrum niveocremeum HHB9708 TaxID=1314777 RepID=A0A164Q8J3_9AGAM|nr:hypothetical protein SISNIDRAFT_469448 [Sistotremastrum niveocremeum HHB9708]
MTTPLQQYAALRAKINSNVSVIRVRSRNVENESTTPLSNAANARPPSSHTPQTVREATIATTVNAALPRIGANRPTASSSSGSRSKAPQVLQSFATPTEPTNPQSSDSEDELIQSLAVRDPSAFHDSCKTGSRSNRKIGIHHRETTSPNLAVNAGKADSHPSDDHPPPTGVPLGASENSGHPGHALPVRPPPSSDPRAGSGNSHPTGPEMPSANHDTGSGPKLDILIDITRQLADNFSLLSQSITQNRTPSNSAKHADGKSNGSDDDVNDPKHGPKHHTDTLLKKRVRAVLARLEHREDSEADHNGFLPPLTPIELTNFGSDPLTYGPTRENFRVCYDQEPKNTEIGDRIWIHIRGRRVKYRQLEMDPEEKERQIVRNRRRGRRLEQLYYRRLNVIRSSTTLREKFGSLILRLQAEGMSDDETDTESFRPQLLVHRRLERSAELTAFLRDLDLMHLKNTHYDEAGNRKPGQFPLLRKASRIRSRGSAVPRLPLACYSNAWLTSMKTSTDPERRSVEEVDLNIDYDSEITTATLRLPASFQE